jgi:hypothetical protein
VTSSWWRLAQAEGVLVTQPGIAGKSDIAAELKVVPALGPREIVLKAVNWSLCIVAVNHTLIEAIKQIPGLVGVAGNAGTLSGKSPT